MLYFDINYTDGLIFPSLFYFKKNYMHCSKSLTLKTAISLKTLATYLVPACINNSLHETAFV